MTLVEGFEPDAVALARILAEEGRDVTIAAPVAASEDVAALGELGVAIREHADLDADPGEHDEAFLGVWTAEVEPRVERLRAAGCRLRCLADLVLERAPVPSIGITGTAGKTTTSAYTVALLREAGVTVQASTTARAGNLWPTAELLAPAGAAVVVCELTSSHLCFMSRSPSVAVVTSFWPDHLELHGSLARYRRAKETIVRHQTAADAVVVHADDHAAVAIGAVSPGRAYRFSAAGEVECGAFRRGDELVVRDAAVESSHALPAGLDRERLLALLGAAAAALAARARPVVPPTLPATPFRRAVVGRRGRTALVDDSLAATPTKTAGALAAQADGSLVLVAGGARALGGREVHAAPEERDLLERACGEARRAARLVVCFGSAADRLVPLLRPERTIVVDGLEDAIRVAGTRLADEDEALLVSPMFPLSQPERERVAWLLRELAAVRDSSRARDDAARRLRPGE